jgi:hypothetical protein
MAREGLSLRADPSRDEHAMLVRAGAGGAARGQGAPARPSLGAGTVAMALVRAGLAAGLLVSAGRGAWRLAEPQEAERAGQGSGAVAAPRNLAESPLAWLHGRKGADGRPLLDDRAYLAGERFRQDVTAAAMLPQVTVNWSRLEALSRSARPRDPALASEHTLAARQRVRAAYRALGPRMGDFVLDVCGFLEPLQEAERRRGWPARAGKLVLQLALDRLADHYGVASEATGPRRGHAVAWRADDAQAGMAAWLDAG